MKKLLKILWILLGVLFSLFALHITFFAEFPIILIGDGVSIIGYGPKEDRSIVGYGEVFKKYYKPASKGDQTGPVSANGKLSPVLVEESLMLKNLQGEWKQECHKVGKYYVQSKVLYIENVIISSWKWYDTADCKAQPIGEYWDQWQVISENVSQKSSVFTIKVALMDGHPKQCPEVWTTFSLSNDNGLLYYGDKYEGTEQALDCLEWPTELNNTPFLFSRPLHDDESVKEYTSSLKRV